MGRPAKPWNVRREEIIKVNKDILVPIDAPPNFIGAFSKFQAECKKCGYQWDLSVSNAKKTGCPKCKAIKPWSAHLEEANEVNPNIEVLAKKRPARDCSTTKVRVKCRICKYEWRSTVNWIKTGRGCPNCSNQKPKTWAERKTQISKVNTDILFPNIDDSKIVKNADFFEATCAICENTWDCHVGNATQGNGCPHCNSSKGEKAIKKYLDKNNIKHIREQSFKDLYYKNIKCKMRFDFYLPDHNLLVEFHGEQHYRNRSIINNRCSLATIKNRDELKLKYALKNGYRICYIPFDKKKQIDELLNMAINSREKLIRFDEHLL